MNTERRAELAHLLADQDLDAEAWSTTPPSTAQLDAAFGREAPRMLDIGPGNGEATLAWACAHPDHDVLAVEVHQPGLARLLRTVAADGPPNIRAIEADALTVVAALPDALHGVRVLFPDPWPKRRHLHRRLVDTSFVALAADALVPDGVLHLATDWADYADQMRAAVQAEPRLRLDGDTQTRPGHPPPSTKPARPVTAYERRGLEAGRTITDLVATRIDDTAAVS